MNNNDTQYAELDKTEAPTGDFDWQYWGYEIKNGVFINNKEDSNGK